jgi:putative flippase GtrA
LDRPRDDDAGRGIRVSDAACAGPVYTMIERVIALLAERRRFLLYTCIGASGVALDYLLFLGLTQTGWVHYQPANVLSTTAGILNNFLLNVRFNFRVRDRLLVRFLTFYAVGLTGMGVTALLLFLFVGLWGYPSALVKLGTLFVVLLLQYYLNRSTSFRGAASGEPTA